MVAFFCRTPIHVFRTIQLSYDSFESNEMDVYIFNTFTRSEEIYSRLLQSERFGNVYYIKDEDYLKHGKAENLRTAFLPSGFKSLLQSRKYDEIFLFNIYGAFNELIYNTSYINNNQLRVNMIEDGPAIYHIEEYKDGIIKKYIYPILGIRSYLSNINTWWFSKPEMMSVIGNGAKAKLPIVDKTNQEFVNMINYVFEYVDNSMISDADIIIMEECYWNDGLLKGGEDYELFKAIKNKFGDYNIAIKMHPRTRKNRFEEEFNVVEANGIPWEVYALNMDMNKKILVSLSCSTMISSKLLYGDETYSLLMYPMLIDKIIDKNTGRPYLTQERCVKIDSQRSLYDNKEKFAKADDLEEAECVLRKWLIEKERELL